MLTGLFTKSLVPTEMIAKSAFLTPASLFNCDKIWGLLCPPTALIAKLPWCWVKNFRPGANSGVMPLCFNTAPPMPTAMLSPTMAILGPLFAGAVAKGAAGAVSAKALLADMAGSVGEGAGEGVGVGEGEGVGVGAIWPEADGLAVMGLSNSGGLRASVTFGKLRV